MARPNIYKIHPAIGIARLGDAGDFFIGPETPGLRPTGEKPGVMVPPYKDGGKIKPQAARFRIFEYALDKNGMYQLKREVPLKAKGVTVVWRVHLANRKASFFNFKGMQGEDRAHTAGRRNAAVPVRDRQKLEIDPLERKLTVGRSPAVVHFDKSAKPAGQLWPDPPPTSPITTLGRMTTDTNGRLIVIGGSGRVESIAFAAPISTYANNDGWYDDVSDGPVMADLNIDGTTYPVEPAWLLVGPPDFAPQLPNLVSLYDRLYDVAARELTIPPGEAAYTTGALKGLAAINAEFKANGGPVLKSYKPDFSTEIYPILFKAAAAMFLYGPVSSSHRTLVQWVTLSDPSSGAAGMRQYLFGRLRKPNTLGTAGTDDMPKLLGDEPYPIGGAYHKHARLTLTETQYAIMEQWAKGNFIQPPSVPPVPPSAPNITPEGLDQAALENCVGGAFFPGIEVSWLIRNAKVYAAPFRIKHGVPSTFIGDAGQVVRAGYFSRQMALPWTADFLQCKMEHVKTGPFAGDWGWWPAQRPDAVFASASDFKAGKSPERWHRSTRKGAPTSWASGGTLPNYVEFFANWKKFGFVVEDPANKDVFIETEREADIP